MLLLLALHSLFSFFPAAWAQSPPTPPASSFPLTIASSELTMRTTASVDIQVCAGAVLSDERVTVQTAVLEKLQYILGRTTAVYLVRQYTTNAGTVCFLYVYQAPSTEAAALTETLILMAAPAPTTTTTTKTGSSSATDNNNNNNNNNDNTLLLLEVNVNEETLQCTVAAVPWRGEDPPLPLWNASAADIVLWSGIIGGVLASCLLVVCCFAALSRSEDERRARAVLETDRTALRRLLSLRRPHPAHHHHNNNTHK